MKATTFDDFLKKQLKNREFRIRYEKELFIGNISKIILDLRQKTGYTQTQLAKKVDTTQSVIARLESGRNSRVPSLDLLNRIAHAFNAHLNISFELNQSSRKKT